jgi:hypothetical protein
MAYTRRRALAGLGLAGLWAAIPSLATFHRKNEG